MNNNNFELTIAIKGLEVTSNGCTCEDIQFTSKGNFGNEYVAVLGEALNHMLTKIPDAAPCSIEKRNITEENFVEVESQTERNISKKVEQRWDLPAVWKVITSTLPTGFNKAGVGSYVYTYECENDSGKKERTTIKISFNDSIDLRIYTGDTKASFYLYEDADRSWVDGINPTLIDELISELPEDVREFVRTFVKKVLNK